MERLYYLVAQLPAFSVSDDSSVKLPISMDYFRDLCARFMNPHDTELAQNLSLTPPLETESTGSSVLDQWYEKERNLRLALAEVRALKMK